MFLANRRLHIMVGSTTLTRNKPNNANQPANPLINTIQARRRLLVPTRDLPVAVAYNCGTNTDGSQDHQTPHPLFAQQPSSETTVKATDQSTLILALASCAFSPQISLLGPSFV
jgi:hypothetical protein